MKNLKLPFWVETQLIKILKPNIVTIVETFIDGKPSKKFYGKSLVANFLQWYYVWMSRGGVTFVTSPAPFNSKLGCLRIDTGAISGTLSGIPPTCSGGAGVVSEGIVLGSAVVVPAPASFNVGTLIAAGVGAGQLQYQANGSTLGATIVGQNTSCRLERSFNNNSGGNVTVNAIAIYSTGITGGVMIYLDAVSPADVIANGQVYTVQITFQTTT